MVSCDSSITLSKRFSSPRWTFGLNLEISSGSEDVASVECLYLGVSSEEKTCFYAHFAC